MSVPITQGTGASSVAAEVTGGLNYQQIKIVDGTNGSVTPLIVNSDGTLNARISGSVATAGGTFTGSVSGTVGASIIGTVPVVQSGTVITSISGGVIASISGGISSVALAGANTVSVVGVVGQTGTVITSVSGGVIASISGGISSVALAGANTVSVVGTVGASIIGAVPTVITSIATAGAVMGSVAALQATNPWIITGSVQGSFTPSGNQSVSGTVGASVIGNVNITITSLATAGGALPVTGSFAIGSASVVQQGTWNTSVTQAAGSNPWVMTGSVQGTMSVLGTVPVTQATASNPWIITGSVQGSFSPSGNQSVSGTVQVDVRSSVAVAIISGSIAATFTPPANQSVSGTVGASIIGTVPITQSGTLITSVVSTIPSSVLVGASIFGQLPGGTAVLGSVAALQGTNPWNIAGSVAAVQTGTWSASVMTNIITSIATAGAVMGSVATLQGTNPWIVTSSIAGGLFPISGSVAAVITNANVNVSGSVAAFVVGSSSIITRFADSSILAVPVGSVITVFQAPSIVGTYAEDAASASGDKGFLVMGARNDTLSSVTSADGDYSSHVVGPAGELIAANAPFTKWVSGTTSIMYGASVAVIAAQGASIFTYVTGVQIANMSANQALITFQGASSSTLGFTIAPASGGSNIVFANAIKTNANGAFTASISGVSSVYVSAQGFIAKI